MFAHRPHRPLDWRWVKFTGRLTNLHPYHKAQRYLTVAADSAQSLELDPRSIISIPPNTCIYPFGATSHSKIPLLRFSQDGWTVREGEAWAVISTTTNTGGSGKGTIFKTLLGHTRIAPDTYHDQAEWIAQGGLYPFIPKSIDPYSLISHVSFRQRRGEGGGGAFFDYTARYGAIWDEEDKVTLRQSLHAALGSDSEQLARLQDLAKDMNLEELLDLPLLTLSNGQTRRARIVKAILEKPEVLLLDEPLTGLDSSSRDLFISTLSDLPRKVERAPRIIMGLRRGEVLPSWITNILEINEGMATPHSRRWFDENVHAHTIGLPVGGVKNDKISTEESVQGRDDLLVDLKAVNVAYGDRKILKNIKWQICRGERWHLQGSNGSGKTTLLALLTGDHPQSYTQPHLLLPSIAPSTDLPSPSPSLSSLTQPPSSPHTIVLRQRKHMPTAYLRTLIGVVSPEMFDAFPRRHPGMSVWEAVGTGFGGGFVPRTRDAPPEIRKTAGDVGWVDVSDDELALPMHGNGGAKPDREGIRKWRVGRCWEVLDALGPAGWCPSDIDTNNTTTLASVPSARTKEFAALSFNSLSPGEQRLVLLMRALVSKPPLVFLDEVWSGMDDAMVSAARRYLRGESKSLARRGWCGVDEEQAVVVITHWDEEVPWGVGEVKKMKLDSTYSVAG